MSESKELLDRLSRLIRVSSAKGFEVAEVNFNIGRLMAKLCEEGDEKAIDDAAAFLNGQGLKVFPEFLFNAYRVFKSLKTEVTLQKIKHNLGGSLNWGFLVAKATKAPEGDNEEARRYWEMNLAGIEKGIVRSQEQIEKVMEHYDDIPDSVKPQAAGMLAACGCSAGASNGEVPAEQVSVAAVCTEEEAVAVVRHPVRKILHIGDEHGDDSAMLSEVKKSSHYIVDRAKEELPNLIISSGDILDCRQSHDSPALIWLIEFIIELTNIAPVFILRGTTTHDGLRLKFLESLHTRHKVYVSETVEQVGFAGGNFFPVDFYQEGLDAIIYSLPPASKANILAKAGTSLQDASKAVTDLLKSVFVIWGGISDEAHVHGIPTIISAHGTLVGAITSTGQKMTGKDIEFSRADIAAAHADVVCLAHIHKAQSWEEDNIFYCGSIAKLNVGETEDKGFWIHNLTPKRENSRFVVIPTKDIISASFEGFPDFDQIPEISKNSLVRVCYKVSEEDVHTVDEQALRSKLMAMGAGEVRIEKTIIPKQMVRAAGISCLSDIGDKVKKWGETTAQVITEGMLEKANILLQPPDCVFRDLGLEMPRRLGRK